MRLQTNMKSRWLSVTVAYAKNLGKNGKTSLLQITDRKSHMAYRIKLLPMTLSDLHRPFIYHIFSISRIL